MHKMLLLVMLGLVGCSGTTGSTDGGPAVDAGGSSPVTAPPGCTSDADCGTNQRCNTRGHVCMDACAAASDCTSAQSACTTVTEPDGGLLVSGKVCTCTTDSACGTGQYCNTNDLLCEGHCIIDSDCSDYSSARVCKSGACMPGL